MARRFSIGKLGRLFGFLRPRWGVRGSLFAAFAVIAGMALIISAGPALALGHLGGRMVDLSGRDIPRLAASLQLSAQSASLASQGPALLASESDEVLAERSKKMSEAQRLTLQKLGEIIELGADKNVVAALTETVKNIDDTIKSLGSAAKERLGIAARALEFTILTAARTGEVIGARWDEINLKSKVWTVPAGRMKGEREHRVALTDAAVAVLEAMHQLRQNEFVFPGDRRAMMSNMAMEMLLRRMGRNVTVHGFRSTFRDWAAERTNFPSEVAEAALAHVVGDKVEAAYRRGDLFEKRRRLMEAWAEYCAGRPADGVVALPMRDAS